MQSILGKSNAKYFEYVLKYVKCKVFWNMSNEKYSVMVKCKVF